MRLYVYEVMPVYFRITSCDDHVHNTKINDRPLEPMQLPQKNEKQVKRFLRLCLSMLACQSVVDALFI